MALDWPWWRAWFPVDAVVAAALCLAGVALVHVDLDFAWQAWRLVTWTCTLRGRRGTYGTGLSGGALGSQLTPLSPPFFAWQAWHLVTSTSTFRGRRGTWRHRRAFCVAGLWHWTGTGGALGSQLTPLSPRLFAWQAWHLATSTCILRGRRGTW